MPSPIRRLSASAILVLTVVLVAAMADVDHQGQGTTSVRGMTVSCQSWGWEWGSDEMVATMDTLKALGVNWIAIHPYGGIRADGSVTLGRRLGDDVDWLTRPIAEAHRRGIKIMIKPHIAYWGSPFSWRGDITFTTDEQWQRFFRDYERWITRLAELCSDADAFVVGTELDRTVHFEAEWRKIIAAVDARTDAPLTYAANWTDFRRVPFWDTLDVIGIQAYFPLTEHAGLPDHDDLREAWRRLLEDLDRYAREQGRDIVFAELGYNRSDAAAIRPWESRSGGEHADECQRRCLDTALEALATSDSVVGAFLWKWFPGETRRGNFLKSTPAMREVIGKHWKQAE